MRVTNEPTAESAPGTHRRLEMPIFEAPRLRRPEEGERQATWLEMFFDLVFVVAVDQVARHLEWPVSLGDVLRYAVLYVPVWWAWVGYVIYADRFGTDDLGDRLLTLCQIGAVAVIAVRAHDATDRGAAAFSLAYGAFRLIIAIRYALAAYAVREVRGLAARQATGYFIAALLWMIAAFAPAGARYWLWGLGFIADLGTPLTVAGFHIEVPPGGAHLESRFGTFVNIVLGEGFFGLVEGMRDISWGLAPAAVAAMALLVGFGLWWMYFDMLDTGPVEMVKRERRTMPYKLWVYSHLPLSAGIAAAAIAIGNAVSAATESVLDARVRWLLCGSMALCFASMCALAVSYALAGAGRDGIMVAVWRALSAVAALLVGAFGTRLGAVGVVAWMTALSLVQIGRDLRVRRRARRERADGGTRAGGATRTRAGARTSAAPVR